MYREVFEHERSNEKRSILLFMDNAGCHPEDLKSKFSNIPKFVSYHQTLLPNSYNKVQYRKLFL